MFDLQLIHTNDLKLNGICYFYDKHTLKLYGANRLSDSELE
jgi:hypothetical protein